MTWQDKKYRADCSIEILNEWLANKIEKDGRYFRLEIKENGQFPCWKTVYLRSIIALGRNPDDSFKISPQTDKTEYQNNLSEGFDTWEEVRIYFSGMRDFLTFSK